MNIVIDTSILLCIALNEEHKSKAIELTYNSILFAPNILYYEVGNALSALVKRDKITANEALTAWNIILNIPVKLEPINILEAIKTAFKHKRYSYDCYFIQLASSKGYTLMTLDRGLKHLSKELNINILEL